MHEIGDRSTFVDKSSHDRGGMGLEFRSRGELAMEWRKAFILGY